jgi:hypothetical protein
MTPSLIARAGFCVPLPWWSRVPFCHPPMESRGFTDKSSLAEWHNTPSKPATVKRVAECAKFADRCRLDATCSGVMDVCPQIVLQHLSSCCLRHPRKSRSVSGLAFVDVEILDPSEKRIEILKRAEPIVQIHKRFIRKGGHFRRAGAPVNDAAATIAVPE